MNNKVGWFFATLAMMLFLAPLFMVRGRRAVAEDKQAQRVRELRKTANRAFAWYALGAIFYVAGVAAMLPAALIDFNFPSVIRLDGDYFLLYNTLALDSRGFLIYMIFFLPLFMISATAGLLRFEKSAKVMETAEWALKKERERA